MVFWMEIELMRCELNYYYYCVIFLFFLSFPWNCKGFSRTFLVFDVYLVVVVGTPKVEPIRVMNLCIFNHNTILSLLDMETFSSWYIGFDLVNVFCKELKEKSWELVLPCN